MILKARLTLFSKLNLYFSNTKKIIAYSSLQSDPPQVDINKVHKLFEFPFAENYHYKFIKLLKLYLTRFLYIYSRWRPTLSPTRTFLRYSSTSYLSPSPQSLHSFFITIQSKVSRLESNFNFYNHNKVSDASRGGGSQRWLSVWRMKLEFLSQSANRQQKFISITEENYFLSINRNLKANHLSCGTPTYGQGKHLTSVKVLLPSTDFFLLDSVFCHEVGLVSVPSVWFSSLCS